MIQVPPAQRSPATPDLTRPGPRAVPTPLAQNLPLLAVLGLGVAVVIGLIFAVTSSNSEGGSSADSSSESTGGQGGGDDYLDAAISELEAARTSLSPQLQEVACRLYATNPGGAYNGYVAESRYQFKLSWEEYQAYYEGVCGL